MIKQSPYPKVLDVIYVRPHDVKYITVIKYFDCVRIRNTKKYSKYFTVGYGHKTFSLS